MSVSSNPLSYKPAFEGGTRSCARCGKAIVGRRRHAKWCSESCRVRAWEESKESRTKAVQTGIVVSVAGRWGTR